MEIGLHVSDSRIRAGPVGLPMTSHEWWWPPRMPGSRASASWTRLADRHAGPAGAQDLLAQLQWPATLGFAETHGSVPRVWETERLALIGREIVPPAAAF
jgi:hypothetical protein